MDLVTGRECGNCTACCTHLRIEDKDLKKLAGTPCIHLCEEGCSIYTGRPETCRNWYCGWRYMPQLNEDWRPDKSDILIRLTEDGLIFEPLNSVLSLKNERILEIIGGSIHMGLATYISVPTKVGYCHSLVKLNDKLKTGVDIGNFYETQIAILEAIYFGMTQKTDLVEPLE